MIFLLRVKMELQDAVNSTFSGHQRHELSLTKENLFVISRTSSVLSNTGRKEL